MSGVLRSELNATVLNRKKSVRATYFSDMKIGSTNIFINPNVIMDNGEYTIKYRNKKFLIASKVFPNGALKVKTFEEMLEKQEEMPSIKFLLKYTPLSKKLFSIVKKNENIVFSFGIDIIKYYEDLCEENGLNKNKAHIVFTDEAGFEMAKEREKNKERSKQSKL